MRLQSIPVGLSTFFYALSYLPYVMVTRYAATTPDPVMGRALTGLEILPAMMLSSAFFTFAFIILSGWWRELGWKRIGPLPVPVISRWTLAAGTGAALILIAVPLSYTFRDVSIPYMQLIMRGDILVIAPLVDILLRRKIHWWSIAALVIVALAMVMTISFRGGLRLPALAIGTIVIYGLAYFGRLFAMSKIAKNNDPATLRRFFCEEKVVSFPLAVAVLLIIALGSNSGQGGELAWGHTEIWSHGQLWIVLSSGIFVAITGVFSALILLDKRENSFCVPLERSASILAGIVGSLLLALLFGGKMPGMSEFAGATLLVGAVVLLAFGPRVAGRAD